MAARHGLLFCVTVELVKAWREHRHEGRLRTGAVMVAGAGRGAGWLAARVCSARAGVHRGRCWGW